MLPDPAPSVDPDPVFPRRTWPWWLLIIAACTTIFAARYLQKQPNGPLPDPAAFDNPVLKIQARYALGVHHTLGPLAGAREGLEQLVDSLDTSAYTLIDRLRLVPLAGELLGRDAALERLDAIDAELIADPSLDQGFRADADTLRALYQSGAAPSTINPADADALRKRHNWFARLGLAFGKPDADPDRAALLRDATRTLIGIFVLFIPLLVALLAGFVLFIVGATLLGTGRIRPALPPLLARVSTPPRAPPAFLESFALFLVAFIIAGAVGYAVESATGLDLTFALAWLVALIAFWPLARGSTFAQLRHALGWTRGRGILTEMLCGVAGHIAGLPIVLLGLLITILIIAVTGTDATHPGFEGLDTSSPIVLIALAVMTTLWAPLVEESLFRGALYAHLRGAGPAARRIPALAAALLTAFIFAAIHPQGIGGVPVLTAIGFNLCILREWRGSLIAPITAHALHNGYITLIVITLLA